MTVPPIHYNSTLAPVEHADLMLTQIISAAESARRAIAAMEGVRLTDSSSRQEVAQNGDNVSPSSTSSEISDTEVLETAYSKTYEDAQLWKRRYLELKAQREPVSVEECAKALLLSDERNGADHQEWDDVNKHQRRWIKDQVIAVLDTAGVSYAE